MAELAASTIKPDFPNIQPPPPVQPRDPSLQISASKQSSVESDHPPHQQQSESGGSETEDSTENVPLVIKRAISCDSICSDTSVALGDLEEANVTGYLCIGFEYER